MSDFTSNFWSVFVTTLTLVGIIACGILLWMAGRKKVSATADNTTGHVWDEDLVEMNNPLPRWWVWLFVITIVFGLGYLAAYPGLGTFTGKLNWTQKGEYEAEMAKAKAEIEPLYARFASMKPEDVAVDPQAHAIGERLFMNNCAQCHGSDARGSKGFPTLRTTTGCMAATPKRSAKPLKRGASAICLPWLLRSDLRKMSAICRTMS